MLNEPLQSDIYNRQKTMTSQSQVLPTQQDKPSLSLPSSYLTFNTTHLPTNDLMRKEDNTNSFSYSTLKFATIRVLQSAEETVLHLDYTIVCTKRHFKHTSDWSGLKMMLIPRTDDEYLIAIYLSLAGLAGLCTLYWTRNSLL